MFLTYDKVFPHGATADDLLRIIRPRPGLPFTRSDARRTDPAAVDHVHPAPDRPRRAPPRRAGVPVARAPPPGRVRGDPRPAGRRRLHREDGGHVVLPDAGDVRLRRRPHRRGTRARAEGPRRGARAPPARARRGGARRPGLRLHPRAARAARGVHRRRGTAAPVAGRPAVEHRDGARHPRRPRDDRRRARPVARRGCCPPLRSRPSSRGSRTTAVERASRAACRAACTRSVAPSTTLWGATTTHSCWRGPCSCSCRGSRRSTTSGCSRGATRRSSATPGRSTVAATRGRRSTRRCGSRWSRGCWSWSGCATRTRPSRASSACPMFRTASWHWRGGTAMPPPSCGSHSRVGSWRVSVDDAVVADGYATHLKKPS